MADEVIALNDGHKIPVLGLGTWLSNGADECKDSVRAALDAGYRHIDTAFSYGNETFIGEVLQEYFKAGKLKRKDIFITTKLWMTYLEPDRVPLCMAESLKRLQLDYVDLYLIHFPVALKHNDNGDLIPMEKNGKPITTDVKIEHTWKAMEQLVKDGKARSIGVSNCNMEQMERICEVADVKPTTNQEEGEPRILEDAVAKNLATKYKKSVAQILVRQLMQRGIIVIPKSVHANRIKENFEVFDFKLTENEMEKLAAQDKNLRLFLMNGLQGHKEFPFKELL